MPTLCPEHEVNASASLLNLVSPLPQDEFGKEATEDLSNFHGYQDRKFVESDQTPYHNRLLVHPRGRIICESVRPVRHLYPDISRGFFKAEQPVLEICSICYAGTGGPGEMCGNPLYLLLRDVQDFYLWVSLVIFKRGTGQFGYVWDYQFGVFLPQHPHDW